LLGAVKGRFKISDALVRSVAAVDGCGCNAWTSGLKTND
jgi:hypothetical protein